MAGEVLTAALLNTHLRDNLNAVRVSYGTTLPVSPGDSDLAILVDSTSNPTYLWKFRYNSAEATYKWEYIGGSPKRTFTSAPVSSAAGTAVWSAALGTSFALPNAGDYDIRWSGRADGNAAGTTTDMGFGVGASPAADDFVTMGNALGYFNRMSRKTGLSAAAVIDYYIRDNDSTRRVAWSARSIEILPVRII